MKRRLIIDGNAVYEIDEECMLEKQRREAAGENAEENAAENTAKMEKKSSLLEEKREII